ncbi:hypothetical protein ACP3XN_26685, partial [Salmonella enterica]
MTRDAGVLRSAESLDRAAGAAARAAAAVTPGTDVEAHALRNLATVAAALCAMAAARTESRGAHARVDHPDT